MARVLWLSDETPDRNGQGGQRRQFFQIREITRAGHSVTVISLGGPQDDTEIRKYARVIRTQTHWRGRIPRLGHRALLQRVARWPWDATVLAHTESWLTFGTLARTVQSRLWVDLHNVLGTDLEGSHTKWHVVECQICATATAVSVCSEQERGRLAEQQPGCGADTVVMHHGIDPTEWVVRRAPSADPVVKLFGNWKWAPNRRGLEWFLQEVWSQVDVPGARCEIAGSGAVIPPASGEMVTFVGRVSSVSEWVRDAWVVAVPVIAGVGAPVKYLEALATRAPVISTQDGAPMARDAAALVSDDPRVWAGALRGVLGGAKPPADTAVPLATLSWSAATVPLLQWLEDS